LLLLFQTDAQNIPCFKRCGLSTTHLFYVTGTGPVRNDHWVPCSENSDVCNIWNCFPAAPSKSLRLHIGQLSLQERVSGEC